MQVPLRPNGVARSCVTTCLTHMARVWTCASAYSLRNSLIILTRSVDRQTLPFCLFPLCILCAGLTELRFVSKDAIFLCKLFRTLNIHAWNAVSKVTSNPLKRMPSLRYKQTAYTRMLSPIINTTDKCTYGQVKLLCYKQRSHLHVRPPIVAIFMEVAGTCSRLRCL
jgi:hypothetical protein